MGEPPLSRLLPIEAIGTDIHVGDWRAAIRAAGELLVTTGVTTADYIQQMQDAVDEYGPYIVIAPGLALAHARPAAAVLRTGLSWAKLSAPVAFGHAQNDPVHVVIGLAAVDHDGHSSALSQLAQILADRDHAEELKTAHDASQIHSLITDYEGSAQ